MRSGPRTLLVSAFVAGAVLASSGWVEGHGSRSDRRRHWPPRTGTDPAVLAAFDDLEQHIAALERPALSAKLRRRLLFEIRSAHKTYEWSEPCAAARILEAYLHETQARRHGTRVALMEDLHARGWTLREDMLASASARQKCDCRGRAGRPPEVGLRKSNNRRLAGSISFGSPRLLTVDGGGETFTRLQVPGLESAIGTPGEPEIPVLYRLIGIPQGATPQLRFTPDWDESVRVNLHPAQEQAVDQSQGEPPDPSTFADPPFVKNEKTYATDAFTPAIPCTVRLVGQYRDLQLAQLACAAGQYNPVTERLRLISRISFDVSFEGGDGTFISDQTTSPFESAPGPYMDTVLNREALPRYVRPSGFVSRICLGEELLVLTHPSFREAADRLAAWKREKGISTSVFDVADAAGPGPDTNTEIEAFIEDRYDGCVVRPSYVLLMGDAEYIPTFYPPGLPDVAGSDFPYANYVQVLFDAFFPDFGLGRIPVDTLAQANVVVDKIISYEKTPPFLGVLGGGGPFYTTVGVASQFQCCQMNADGTPFAGQAGRDQRAFVETSELVRNVLLPRGYEVERIYTRTVDPGGYCAQVNASGGCLQIQAPYGGDPTPRRYFDGRLLPVDLAPAFPWNGDTSDIVAAWNAGRFLMLHRDHGWWDGWSDPGFTSTNVTFDLANGALLPVVYSVNCASGLFDDESLPVNPTYPSGGGPYFAERLLRLEGGGAVGFVGDTRNSPSWANNALTRGLFDATWPATVPDFGAATSHRRLGDILNWAKIYLATQVNAPQTAGSITTGEMGYEYNIWHVLGDPTLEMWTENPHRLTLPDGVAVRFDDEGVSVGYELDGAIVTALQPTKAGLVPIGRGRVGDGEAVLPYVRKPEPGAPVLFSVSFPNAVGGLLSEAKLVP